jgi:curved DNA-binding protein CbpA
MQLDPFELLGVKPDSTDKEVKQARDDLMASNHPDKAGAKPGTRQWEQCNRMAREINAAYEQIKTAQSRRAYQAKQNFQTRPHRQPSPQARQNPPSPQQPAWKSPRQRAEEKQAWARRHEEEIQQIVREHGAEEAAWLAKRPWTREWRKVRQAFDKNKAACIYGAVFLGMGIYMLIRYPSFRGVELIFWFQHQFFKS